MSSLVTPLEQWPTRDQDRWSAAFVPPPPRSARGERFRRRSPSAGSTSTPAGCEPRRQSPSPRAKSARHPSTWSQAYKSRLERGYGLWLSWLRRSDLHDGCDVTADAVSLFVEDLAQSNGGVSLASYVFELWRALTLLRPNEDWNWLEADYRALKEVALPNRDKRARFVPLESVLHLGLNLMEQACLEPATPSAAIRFRDGLLIAFAAYRPKRAQNMAELRFGSTIREDAGNRVSFEWPDSKNSDPIDATLPDRLALFWHKWLEAFRPLLPNAQTDALWLSQRGNTMAADELSTAMARRTKAALGVALRLHMMRTLYATSMISEAPELRPAVSQQLDHRDARSLEAYELDARSVGASKALDRSLEPLITGRLKPKRHGLRRRTPAIRTTSKRAASE